MATGTLETSIGTRDLNAAALWRSGIHPAQTGLGGRGVVVCIIDYGFDLFHPTLRRANGTTRFARLIDQNGRDFSAADIDALIARGDRRAADRLYDPHANYFGSGGVGVGAHGTWVASIAAGTQSDRFTGVAPETTLIGVQLALPDAAWRETSLDDIKSGQTTWRSYDESETIIDALAQAFRAAQAIAQDGIVFNLSIGAWAGSHHPKAPVNRALSRLAARNGEDGRALFVVAGTGNAGDEAGHFQVRAAPGETARFVWHLRERTRARHAPDKLEVWSDGAIRVRLAAGLQQPVEVVLDRPGRQSVEMAGNRIGVGAYDDRAHDGLHCACFLIAPTPSDDVAETSATAVVEVTAASTNSAPAEAHAWVERDCDGCASHLSPASPEATLTSLATAPGVISVGGLDEEQGCEGRVLAMSGRGPAPWQPWGDAPSRHEAPALAAPAAGLYGARSKTTGFMRGSGTSAAAAITSGAVALAIEWATARGHALDREGLLEVLCGPERGAWRADTGRGALRFQPTERRAEARSRSHGAPLHATQLPAAGDAGP